MDDYFKEISLDIEQQECAASLYAIENELFGLCEALTDMSKQVIARGIGESGYALSHKLEEWSCEAELLAKYAYDRGQAVEEQEAEERTYGSYEDQVRSQYNVGRL